MYSYSCLHYFQDQSYSRSLPSAAEQLAPFFISSLRIILFPPRLFSGVQSHSVWSKRLLHWIPYHSSRGHLCSIQYVSFRTNFLSIFLCRTVFCFIYSILFLFFKYKLFSLLFFNILFL